MKTCVIDLETYYSTTHSLTKKGMHPIKYIMSPETEVISLAYKFGKNETEVIFGEGEVEEFIKCNDWSDCMVIGHNMSGFDGPLLAWRFGLNPRMWGCTLAMARPFYLSTVGVSLKAVAKELGIGEKGSLDAVNTKGKNLRHFTDEELEAMRVYNKLDVDLCYEIFRRLAPKTSRLEAELIDATIRMATEPKFELDMPLIERTLEEERARKHAAMVQLKQKIGLLGPLMGRQLTEDEKSKIAILDLMNNGELPDVGSIEQTGIGPVYSLESGRIQVFNAECSDEAFKEVFSSANKFAAFLQSLSATVPMKASPTNPDKQIPALSKTDQGLLDLLEDENELVAAAAAARLDVKSTILETRLEKFKEVGELLDGKMPIALNYYGAISARWSGAFSLNHQNLPRINSSIKKPTDALRNSLTAPKGHKVVVVDSSQIELRVNHFLWKVKSSMDLFNADPEKADLYKDFASKLYGVPPEEVTKQQRQVGKVAHLGLGYGSGWKTFKQVAKIMGGVVLDDAESLSIVNAWRSAYAEIPLGWKMCHAALAEVYAKRCTQIDDWGLCSTTPEGIKTPTGMIRYPGLHIEQNDKGEREWWYGTGRNRARIYGPKIVENCIQSLSRNIVAEQLITVNKIYPVKHTTHDEIVCIVPTSEADDCLEFMLSTMRTSPAWWPELVLWAEGGYGDTFGDAK